MKKTSSRHCPTCLGNPWITRINRVMTILVIGILFCSSAHAAEDRVIIAGKGKKVSPLDKFDSLKIDTFECRTEKTTVQDIACGKNGLIQSNINIAKDLIALAPALDKRGQSYLTKSQESWRTSRNNFCLINAKDLQGTKATTAFMLCLLDQNKDRHEFLKKQISDRKK